jgi:PhnB protein
MDLNTYLVFDGQSEAAFKSYEKVLGGKILMMMRMGDVPSDKPVSKDQANRIMHICLQVGDRLLMASDVPAEHFKKPQGFHVNIAVKDPVEAERIFSALSEGGKVEMPIAETFWAKRFGMFTDRFGTPWMVNCDKPM